LSNFRGPGLVVSWLEDRRCNLHYINQPIYFPSWLPISWLLDEARSAEFAIHLFAEDVLQSIHSLFDCQVRHEVPMLCYSCNPAFRDPFDCWGWGTKCRISSGYIAFIPFFVYSPESFSLGNLL